MKTRISFIAAILGVSFLTANLYAQKRLTQEIINEFGTKTFNADKDSIFRIVKAVLISHDYAIDIENAKKGLIKTKKKDIGASGNASYGLNSSSAQIRSNYRQYNVTIEEIEKGKTKVVFVPKIYIGEADVSEEKIWVFKGLGGEYKLWETLFKEIEERL